MNADTKITVKQCATCLEYQQTQQHENTILYEMPCKPCKVVDADIFSIKNNTLLCTVDYYRRFHIFKKADGLSADNLIRTAKIVFAELELSQIMVSEGGKDFVSYIFKHFCRQLNIEQATTKSHHNQSNRQVEVHKKFVKITIKNVFIIMMLI